MLMDSRPDTARMDQPFVAAAGPPACWEKENWHTECLHWYLFVEKIKIGMLNVFTGIYLWRNENWHGK